ncbi:MAG: HIT family protein [Holosporaceae bacterium]|jgi:diadenosine tetraphosphate (Ap4A) HIT family hydrolase|nr:HIT family protein [Holosporaceae bacterium]
MKEDDCIFCKIVRGEAPAHKIWEDSEHMAFLSIYPNTLGASVVIPKAHFSSYAFHMPDDELSKLVIKSSIVGRILDAAFEDVGRTAMIFEGFGINHVHAKLFPLHKTNLKDWKPIHTDHNKFFTEYEGYVSSHEYHGPMEDLAPLAERIREASQKICSCAEPSQ